MQHCLDTIILEVSCPRNRTLMSCKTSLLPIFHTSTHASNTSFAHPGSSWRIKHLPRPIPFPFWLCQPSTGAALGAAEQLHRGLCLDCHESSWSSWLRGALPLTLAKSLWDPTGVREPSLPPLLPRGTAPAVLHLLQNSPSQTAWEVAAPRHVGVSLFVLTNINHSVKFVYSTGLIN